MSLPNPNSFNHYNLPTVPQPNLQQSSSSGRKLVHGRNESAPTANQVPLNRAPYLLQTLNSQSPDEEDEEEEEEEEEELNPDPDPDVVVAVPAPSNSPSVTALAAANSENQNPQSIRYRECRKNHAANLGSHVLDGCGEFMPGGEEGTPQFLKCAACDCHRNFHRKESDAGPNFRYGSARTAIVHPVPAPPQRYSNNYNRHHQSRRGPPPQVMLGFGGDAGAPAESSSEDLDALRSYHQQQQPSGQKKRFRTKFSEGQKERMLGFAEKLGWKIQKQDEEEVQQFCSDIGVKRKVFKVWMHNNKQSMEKKKKTPPPPPPPPL